VSWFNDFIGRFSQATKPRPEKLANFIDHLTSPLEVSSLCFCWQGIADGLTYEEFRDRYPEEFRKRENDKYHYRYLYGEVSVEHAGQTSLIYLSCNLFFFALRNVAV